jgi:hypothetical protein
LHGFKVGRDWRFNVEQIDKIRLAEETLGARRRVAVSTPRGVTRLPPGTEAAMSAEPPDETKMIAPESRNSMKTGESRAYGLAADHEGKTETPFHPGQAYEDQNEKFTDLSPSADVSESNLPHVVQLEKENRRLRRVVADQALDIQVLKEVLRKRFVMHDE